MKSALEHLLEDLRTGVISQEEFEGRSNELVQRAVHEDTTDDGDEEDDIDIPSEHLYAAAKKATAIG